MKRKLLLSFALLLISMLGFSQADSCSFYIPNVLSMDCESGNDYQFEIYSSCPISTSKLIVYNRWGELVYEAEGKKIIWDASEAKDNVYYYVYSGMYFGGVGFERQGNISVLR